MRATSASIAELDAGLDGRIIVPDDTGYDEARAMFYGGHDLRPAVIVRAGSVDDVVRTIAYAQDAGRELAVRSGGHSGAGHSSTDGGVQLDLSDLRALDIDVEGRTAWVGSGLTAREYTVAAGAHGLATGFGDAGTVGIGGITLGGGVGFLVRKYGLTIDDLLAADIVTADGRVRRVDAETEPDLFWAIRGGGGNFGVATRFRFRLHPVDTVMGGMLFLPATPDVIVGVHRGGGGCSRCALLDRDRDGRAPDAVPAAGARGRTDPPGDDGPRRRRRGGRACDRAVPSARGADRRLPAAHAVSGDVHGR